MKGVEMKNKISVDQIMAELLCRDDLTEVAYKNFIDTWNLISSETRHEVINGIENYIISINGEIS